MKKDPNKIFKRANTSSSSFPKKDTQENEKKLAEINMKREMERLKIMQQEIIYTQAKVQIHKFDKKVQQKRKVLGNSNLAREERSKRKENHLELLKCYTKKKKEFIHKLDSTDGLDDEELKPFPSVTTQSMNSSMIGYGISEIMEQNPKSRLTVQR